MSVRARAPALPPGIAGRCLDGYNSLFFRPRNAGMAAVWIAAHLAGTVPLPGPEDLRRAVVERLAFLDDATGGHLRGGGKIIPFPLHNVDEVLDDLGRNASARVRAAQRLGAVGPTADRGVTPALLRDQPPVTESEKRGNAITPVTDS